MLRSCLGLDEVQSDLALQQFLTFSLPLFHILFSFPGSSRFLLTVLTDPHWAVSHLPLPMYDLPPSLQPKYITQLDYHVITSVST